MKLLSDTEALDWTTRAGIAIRRDFPLAGLSMTEPSTRVRVTVPPLPNAVIGLAYAVVMTGIEDFFEDNFAGGLLWLQRWEVWSESIDQVGCELLAALRKDKYGTLENRPAHLFEMGEFVRAQTVVSIPLLMQWDAFYIAADGTHAAVVSHEGHVDLISRGRDPDTRLVERLKAQSLVVAPVPS